MAKITSRMLRIARPIIRNVQNIIKQQENLVEETIYRQVQQMVQATLNGAWKGVGATRFAEEMQQQVLPSLHDLQGNFTHHHDNITKAEDIMMRADAAGTKVVGALVDVYRGIYN